MDQGQRRVHAEIFTLISRSSQLCLLWGMPSSRIQRDVFVPMWLRPLCESQVEPRLSAWGCL